MSLNGSLTLGVEAANLLSFQSNPCAIADTECASESKASGKC